MRVSLCQVFVCACASMNVSIHTPIPPTSHPVCKRWGHLRSSAGGECVSTVGSCVCGGRRFWAGRGSVPAICFEPHGAGAAERSSSPGLIPLRTMLSPLPLLSPSISHSSNLLTHLLLTLLLAERSRSIRARTHRRIRTRTRTRAHAHTLTHTHALTHTHTVCRPAKKHWLFAAQRPRGGWECGGGEGRAGGDG